MQEYSLTTKLSKEQIYEMLAEVTNNTTFTGKTRQTVTSENYTYEGDITSYTRYSLQHVENNAKYGAMLRIELVPEEDYYIINLSAYLSRFSEFSFIFSTLMISAAIVFLLLPDNEYFNIYLKVLFLLVLLSARIFWRYSSKKKIEQEALQSFVSLISKHENK